MAIKGAIFDMDGTLTESMHLWIEIGRRYLGGLGYTVTPEQNKVMTTMLLEPMALYMQDEFGLRKSQQQIIDELGATTDSAGRILFKCAEDEAAYKVKIAELNKQECELDVVPVQIPEDANLKYTPEDLWILDGFVEIVAKEEEKKDKE